MAGGKLPVIEIENLTLKKNGRGLYGYNDGTTMSAATWTGVWVSGQLGVKSGQFLPAASTSAWLKITIDGTAHYFPGFNTYW